MTKHTKVTLCIIHKVIKFSTLSFHKMPHVPYKSIIIEYMIWLRQCSLVILIILGLGKIVLYVMTFARYFSFCKALK